jgi:hypothetical protein
MDMSSFVFEDLYIALLAFSASFRIPNNLGIGYVVTYWWQEIDLWAFADWTDGPVRLHTVYCHAI